MRPTTSATRTGAPPGTEAAATGTVAPAVNAIADAQAACHGRAIRSSARPSSSRAWAPRASRAVSAPATRWASSEGSPRRS